IRFSEEDKSGDNTKKEVHINITWTKVINLGVKITNTGKHEKDINGRINKRRMAISKLNNILWDRDITIKTKTNIYNTVVKSTIIYRSETWHLKSARAHKISRREKIRNTVLREKMKVKGSLTEDIKTEQLRWFGHVKRKREDRLRKKIFEWQPMGRRQRGRPNITCTEGILKTMRERGIQEGDWEDREEWRNDIIFEIKRFFQGVTDSHDRSKRMNNI
ncbi:hypothetical protein C0J52_04368, partial [Blattella germanica]